MPAEIHKQVLDYQGGDANAALELVEKFKPLIKRYAFFLHREDSFEDLQRFLLSIQQKIIITRPLPVTVTK